MHRTNGPTPTRVICRACLEDLFMGKLHGLVFGLDICSTYHMSLELDEMEEIMNDVMAAGPGFYMAGMAGLHALLISCAQTHTHTHTSVSYSRRPQ